ncbi:MAG: sporulation protein YunB [Clostridia bacterium]|nr:sporulation protein YunB [Clostridia bacterium]MBQ7897820.1 sporulation protein YunB [Clostridia bacterium]
MKKVIIFLITLILLLLLFFWSVSRLRPLATAFAESRARNMALDVLSRSVEEVIEKRGIRYSDLVAVETDEDKNVTSISTRVENVNVFKSEVSSEILERLSEEGARDISIPLGNLTGTLFFTGRGPRIKARIIEVSFAESTLESTFTQCGINQTRHTLNIKVKIIMQIAVLTGIYSVETEDSIVVADTVIVGKVPDGYTAINKASDELIGDIVDFKAE